MSIKKIRWRPDGLAHKLIQFFEANPDEELTIADIRDKFDVAPTTASNALARLELAGEDIEYVHIARRKVRA